VSDESRSFKVGLDFPSVLRAISKQIYETPLAFIRENVQNAIDAVRIQALRDSADPADPRYRIDVTAEADQIRVRDSGTGMSASELQDYFWTIGASGKRTQEAIDAGCVGMFGIGGFANFGVCHTLEVISQSDGAPHGTLTRLGESEIRAAGTAIPMVHAETSDEAAPRGTLVVGHLREPANAAELRRYLQDFVRFVPSAVHFNGQRISQATFSTIEEQDNLTPLTPDIQEWQGGNLVITGQIYETRGHSLVAAILGLTVAGEAVNLSGHIRFEAGPIDVFKRGFKLCATSIGTIIGVSGRLDCDRFIPTAGRDSLDGPTSSLLGQIALLLERVAVDAVLETDARIAQHTRIFRYVTQRGLVSKLDLLTVRLADGSELPLQDIKRRAQQGSVSVFFGVAQKQALNQIMQARGHIVVLLSGDHYRQQAERAYLEQYCKAKPFDGIIDCAERYIDLNRFEQIFLSELELNISRSYEVKNFRLTAGRLTEDIPVFVKEGSGSQPLDIFVDVRHQEVAKLQDLGFTQIFYSLVATFCREYLGPSLKKWSPRFFGDGALNLDLFAKRRSELWILLKDDIGVVRKSGQRQVFTRSDVQVVTVGAGQGPTEPTPGKPLPRLVHIEDHAGAGLGGFYIRMPDSAFAAYGDLLLDCESRGVVWAGNKILYVASDTVSAAFQYEIRLDEVVAAEINGAVRAEGAFPLDRPLQQMFNGLYFPIPAALERYLVPRNDAEIRLELHCDWIDMRTAKHWAAKESGG
jgi:molecular chaperone HtpG